MILPDVIDYLLTLKYPGSESGRQNWVCYRSGFQVILPVVPAGETLQFNIRPLYGVYAWLGFQLLLGKDLVPNTFSARLSQYGTVPFSGVFTSLYIDEPISVLIFVTEQEPSYISITNRSALAQRFEINGNHLVVSSPQDLVVIMDALRRLHTSSESEQLLQQAVHLLSGLSGQTATPRPPIGGV